MMSFILRAVHMSFWLFVVWTLLRVWELNFEVSPLPAILLPITVFIGLFLWAFLLGRRLQKKHSLELAYRYWSIGLLVGGALLWEFGLTVYLSGWSAVPNMFTSRVLIGVPVQILAIWLAGIMLRHSYGKTHPSQQMRSSEIIQDPNPLPSAVPLESPRSPEERQL